MTNRHAFPTEERNAMIVNAIIQDTVLRSCSIYASWFCPYHRQKSRMTYQWPKLNKFVIQDIQWIFISLGLIFFLNRLS